MDIRAGEIVGLTGLLGSGRTEFALSLFGMNPPTSGDILLDGKELRLGPIGRPSMKALPMSPRTG